MSYGLAALLEDELAATVEDELAAASSDAEKMAILERYMSDNSARELLVASKGGHLGVRNLATGKELEEYEAEVKRRRVTRDATV